MNMIIDEAHAAGIKVYAIPSRWCGLIAGWPILAGHFAASRPDVWMRKEDGSPVIKNFCGPLCSVHHPDVQDHMVQCVETMLNTFDFDGITWDELKTLHETDHHPLAIEKYGHPVSGAEQIATLDIFARCNRRARELKPDLRIISFLYAPGRRDRRTVGVDRRLRRHRPRRPHRAQGRPRQAQQQVPARHQERFNRIAKAHGRRSFALLETQGASVANAENSVRRLPEYLEMAPEHIAIYYRPLVEEPAAEITDRVGPVLRDWRLS